MMAMGCWVDVKILGFCRIDGVKGYPAELLLKEFLNFLGSLEGYEQHLRVKENQDTRCVMTTTVSRCIYMWISYNEH